MTKQNQADATKPAAVAAATKLPAVAAATKPAAVAAATKLPAVAAATKLPAVAETTAPTRARYAPRPLSDVPDVAALLAELGLGAFIDDEVTSHVGRNDIWSGPTTSGTGVFVKHLVGPDATNRFRRVVAFDALSATSPDRRLHGPTLLGSDAETSLLVFELFSEARSGAELAIDDMFDPALCSRAGSIVAALHDLAPDPDLVDATPHPMPPMARFQALPLEVLLAATFAELETWRLLQPDHELVQALGRLREAEAALPQPHPVHGDVRLDQFLYVGDEMYLADWEEFRLGDPARDVGAMTGEWLYHAVHGIPGSIANGPGFTFGREATHDQILTHGLAELERLRPQMAAFWSGYRDARRTPLDDAFTTRAAGYAGWHLVERLFAAAIAAGTRLSAVDRAAAGIGRTLLLTPDAFRDVLGLQESRS